MFICGGKKARGTIPESCANTLSFFVIGLEELCGNDRFSWLLTWQLAMYIQAFTRTRWSEECG